MSWPSDGGPRYVAGAISPGGTIDGVTELARWYVYDRANCHRPVSTGSANRRSKADEFARRACAYLNAGLPLITDDGRPIMAHVAHGSQNAYSKHGCRCPTCTAAASVANIARKRASRARRAAQA